MFSFRKKFCLLLCLAVYLLATVHGKSSVPNMHNANKYVFLEEKLKELYHKDLADCMLIELKENKIVDRLYIELLNDKEMSKKKLEPYLSAAEHSCEPPMDPAESKRIDFSVSEDLYPMNPDIPKKENSKPSSNAEDKTYDTSKSSWKTPNGIVIMVAVVAVFAAVASIQ